MVGALDLRESPIHLVTHVMKEIIAVKARELLATHYENIVGGDNS
jgi:hypothetical protein